MTPLKGFSCIFREYIIRVEIKVTGEHLRRNDDKYHAIKTELFETVYRIFPVRNISIYVVCSPVFISCL
jgi:hypothetical protein